MLRTGLRRSTGCVLVWNFVVSALLTQSCSLRSGTLTPTYRRSLISPLQGVINALLNGQLVARTRDNSRVLTRQRQKTDRSKPIRFLAQKAGFEPALRFSHTTPLAGEPLEPLGYFCMALSFFKAIILYHIFRYLSKLFDPKTKKLSRKSFSPNFDKKRMDKRLTAPKKKSIL